MMADRAKAGTTHRIDVICKDAGASEKTGLTVTVRIRRDSDGYYLKNDGTWTAAPSTEYTATETDATNQPGRYHFNFSLPSGADKYFVRLDGTAAAFPRYQYGELLGVTWSDADLKKAIARLINKSIQGVNTGLIQIFDDDAATVLWTLLLSNDTGNHLTATKVTLTPGAP